MEPALTAIASKYDKSPAQVLLRWHIEEGIVPVPRAGDEKHLAQNIDVFDFTLSSEDMATLSGLDQGEEAARDPDDPANGH